VATPTFRVPLYDTDRLSPLRRYLLPPAYFVYAPMSEPVKDSANAVNKGKEVQTI